MSSWRIPKPARPGLYPCSAQRPRPSSVQKAITEAGELANLVVQMDGIGLFQVVYTDFTEILYADGDRKAILMPIIGHVSKMAFGWAVGQSRSTALALQAWEHAKRTFQQMGISYVGMIMHHDRDSRNVSSILRQLGREISVERFCPNRLFHRPPHCSQVLGRVEGSLRLPFGHP